MTAPPVYRLLLPAWASPPRRTRLPASIWRPGQRRRRRKPGRVRRSRSGDNRLFAIAERDDPDGPRRLTLTGEVDMATAPELADRLRDLRDAQTAVRLDLSKLQFMDISGLHVLLGAVNDAQTDAWNLEIAPEVPHQIARLIELTATRALLWPASSGA
jgi:anti-anti-sigma factor